MAKRKVGPEGAGSSGDLRDRMRDAYKPGANPVPAPGLVNPFKRKKRKPKPAA